MKRYLDTSDAAQTTPNSPILSIDDVANDLRIGSCLLHDFCRIGMCGYLEPVEKADGTEMPSARAHRQDKLSAARY